jgi:hypothetical protein
MVHEASAPRINEDTDKLPREIALEVMFKMSREAAGYYLWV